MAAPRLQIDLAKLDHNAHTLVDRLAARGISVTGVTKATLGSAEVARTLVNAGVRGLGDSRIDNIESMRGEGVTARMTLIRTPMLSQVDRIVEHADVSCNSELEVIAALSAAAKVAGRNHRIVLMVELGDLREGIMANDLIEVARETLRLPNLILEGIGTNLACQSGVTPSEANMAELSGLAESIEANLGVTLSLVSGGNSANLAWALTTTATGRINDLRLGESILLGREPLHRQPIEGLHTDAFTLVAEIIEAKTKPSRPWGAVGETAFGAAPTPIDRGNRARTIVALGHQDTDPAGLVPEPDFTILGASSDHLVLDAETARRPVGAELTFQLNYSALVRAMTSPFVAKVLTTG